MPMADVSVWLQAILICFLKHVHVLEINKKYCGCLFIINEILYIFCEIHVHCDLRQFRYK
jgi:hypothetical protein